MFSFFHFPLHIIHIKSNIFLTHQVVLSRYKFLELLFLLNHTCHVWTPSHLLFLQGRREKMFWVTQPYGIAREILVHLFNFISKWRWYDPLLFLKFISSLSLINSVAHLQVHTVYIPKEFNLQNDFFEDLYVF